MNPFSKTMAPVAAVSNRAAIEAHSIGEALDVIGLDGRDGRGQGAVKFICLPPVRFGREGQSPITPLSFRESILKQVKYLKTFSIDARVSGDGGTPLRISTVHWKTSCRSEALKCRHAPRGVAQRV